MKAMVRMLVSAVLLASVGCVDDAATIQIRHAMADSIDENCIGKKTENQLFGGSVDLGYTSSYMLALALKSNADTGKITAGGQTTGVTSRNDFYVREVVLSYEGNGIPTLDEEVVLGSGTIPAGGELGFVTNLLTARAVERIRAPGIPSEGVVVTVGIRLRGEFAHGSSLETAAFYFPLRVRQTTKVECAATEIPESLTDAEPVCGNWGQDGVYFRCVTP